MYSEIDPVVREEARAVLTDLPQWTVTEDRWDEIQTWLDALGTAVSRAESGGILAAIAELEVLSPLRTTRLGADPVGSAPSRIRLLHNRLVHDLGLVDADPALAAAFAVDPAPLAPVTAEVVQQGLVLHYFAPTDGALGEWAYRQLVGVWAYCRDALDATSPVAGLGLPAELPDDLRDLPKVPAVAAVTNAADSVQAILRWDHDILVLSVLCAPDAEPDGRGWAGLDWLWQPTVATEALVGVARLHLGLGTGPERPTALAVHLAERFALEPDRIAEIGDFVVLSPPEPDDLAIERSIIVLAGSDGDVELSAWAWSRGDAVITPFTRYLVHAAKLRYQARIRRGAGETIRVRPEDTSAQLSTILTRLSDMRVTVDLARFNMATLLGRVPRVGFVAEDVNLAEVLGLQLQADIAYLGNERERRSLAVAVPEPDRSTRTAAPTFGLVTAMAEEFAAMRLLVENPQPAPIAGDRNTYVRGTMASSDPSTPHQVVLTMLGETANNSAAGAVAQLIRSYPSVDQILMVGIAAGVPQPEDPVQHVRLGDVIAATWGVVAYDHVVERPMGATLRQGFPRPSALLAHRAKMLEAEALLGRRKWEPFLDEIVAAAPVFARPGDDTDVLHDRDSLRILSHPDRVESGHPTGYPKVHYGALGSADRSVRHADFRDELAARYGIRGIEMEASGVGTAASASGREWFVVRGVSDYGDAGFSRVWRRYASAAAAAYVAALLHECPPIEVHGGHTAGG